MLASPAMLTPSLSRKALAEELALIAAEFNRILGKHSADYYLSLPAVYTLSAEACTVLESIMADELRGHGLLSSRALEIRTDGLVARLQVAVARLDSTVTIAW